MRSQVGWSKERVGERRRCLEREMRNDEMIGVKREE